MKIISYLEDADKILESSVVALGNFDGVHKGHQELIKTAVDLAKKKGISSVVFTFSNHPMNVLAGKTVVKNIMDINEKAQVFENLGVDYMVNVQFNDFIRKSEPEYFVKRFLIKNLKMQHAVCGFNYTFGFKAEGTSELLKKMGEELGFGVTIIPELQVLGTTVSSTRIRKLISEGNMKEYKDCTGRLYRIEGKVMEGQKLGRKMGFPTVNLNLLDEYALPLNGVYVTKTYVNNVEYKSVTNVGVKPTVGTFQKNAETHIFDFDGDLYGQIVKIEFVDMLRPEKKFDNFNDLAAQIEQDCLDAKAYKC